MEGGARQKVRERRRQARAALVLLAPEPAGELHVLGLDRHPLGVDRSEIGILKELDEVGLRGLLQGADRTESEAKRRDECISQLGWKR
jgi:hypothetical protein